MMQMYIEQKNGWKETLGLLRAGNHRRGYPFSHLKDHLSSRGKTFHRVDKGSVYGNDRCEQDGNEHRISGVKKDGLNLNGRQVTRRLKRKKIDEE